MTMQFLFHESAVHGSHVTDQQGDRGIHAARKAQGKCTCTSRLGQLT